MPRRLADAKQLGSRLGCSSRRHVLRMADGGLMPWGVKLRLRRWDMDELEGWIKAGCKPVR